MIATLGEALIDLIEQPDGRFAACLGGSVCNFTIGLARQGLPVTYLNPLSHDRFGTRFRALLEGSGVCLSHAGASAYPTAMAVVSLDENGVPTYSFHREGVADRDATAEELVARFQQRLELLHTGGLALVPEDVDKTCALISDATTRGAIISVDANLRPQAVSRREEYVSAVLRAMRNAHIVKVSDEDLVHLGLDGVPPFEAAATLFHESSLELIAVTLGGRGAALLTRTQSTMLPVPPDIRIIDTVGAGDCFHAGLIAFLHREATLGAPAMLAALDPDLLRLALRHAMSAASLNIMRPGCDPATWDQTVVFSQQWQCDQG